MVRIGAPSGAQGYSQRFDEISSSSLPDTQIIAISEEREIDPEELRAQERRKTRYNRERRKQNLLELREPSERRWLIAESKGAIANLEQDHHADTAVHLYSTHLLHRKNQRFPHSSWASWPKRMKNVPMPLTEDFVDENNPYKRSRMDPMLVPPSLISETEYERINEMERQENTLMEENSNGINLFIEKDYYNPTAAQPSMPRVVLEPKSVLGLEIDSTFQRTIYKRIHNHRKLASKKSAKSFASSMVPISDPSPVMPLQAKAELFAMIDKILENNSTTMLRTVRPTGFRTWIDIIRNHANLGRTLQRCRELFLEESPSTTTTENDQSDGANDVVRKVKFRQDLGPVTLAKLHHLKATHDTLMPEVKVEPSKSRTTTTDEGNKEKKKNKQQPVRKKHENPYLQPGTYISELLESNYSNQRVAITRNIRAPAYEAHAIIVRNRNRLNQPDEAEGDNTKSGSSSNSSSKSRKEYNNSQDGSTPTPTPLPFDNLAKKSDKKLAKWLDKISAPYKFLAQSPLGPVMNLSIPGRHKVDQGWMAEEDFELYQPTEGAEYEAENSSDEEEDGKYFDARDGSDFEFPDDEDETEFTQIQELDDTMIDQDDQNNGDDAGDDNDDNESDDQFFDTEQDMFANDDIDFHNPTSEDNEEDAELTELMDHSYKIFQSLS